MWQVSGEHATLLHPPLAGHLDLVHPSLGLTQIQLAGAPLTPAALLQISGDWNIDEAVAEHYVRLNDLVATYYLKQHAARPQIYWRCVSDRPPNEQLATGVELILSAETSLLDDRPALHVSSLLPARTGLIAEPSGRTVEQLPIRHRVASDDNTPYVILRLNESWSYLEMAFPGDFTTVSLDRPPDATGIRISWELLNERLEKGVIRRARVRGYFVPRDRDAEHAQLLFERFLAAPLPLTT